MAKAKHTSRSSSASRSSQGSRGARSIDSASIVFGLVNIPVKIFSTTEPSHEVHFHMIHAGCGERLKQQYMCPKHGKVERADMAKGYSVDKGTTIELDPKELKALDAVASDEIALTEFVPATAVDPIFVDRTYYLGPDKGAARAYRLLRDALSDAELVGIAHYEARGKSYIVMVRPFESGLALHQLRYADEIKPWSVVDVDALPKPAASELELAKKLISHLARDTFDPTQFTDEVKRRVEKLLEAKIESGEQIVAPEQPTAKAIPDLMAALRASLEAKPTTTTTSHAEPAHPRAKRAGSSTSHRVRKAAAHPARARHTTRSKRAAA